MLPKFHFLLNIFAATLMLHFYFPSYSGYIILDSKPLNPPPPPPPNTTTCPSFDYFDFFWRRQCPVKLGEDLRCVIGLPCDTRPSTSVLNCATIEEDYFPHLQVLNASEMIDAIKYRDPYGRPWCMLSFLYAPNCIFSSKVASSFHQVAPLFPKLWVVAVDMTVTGKHLEQLIHQYGIASTPVMALWESGHPKFRLYDDYSKTENLIKAIHTRTDLRARDISNFVTELSDDALTEPDGKTILTIEFIKKYPTEKEFLALFYYLQEDLEFDWPLVAALLTILINSMYFAIQVNPLRDYLLRKYPSRRHMQIQMQM